MPSQSPSRFNRYRVTSDTELTEDVWNNVFADVVQRIESVEDKATGYDAIVNAGVGVAIQRVNESLAPAVNEISALIAQANVYLSQLQQSANGIGANLVTTNSTRRFVTDPQLTNINTIPSLKAQVDTLTAKVNAPGSSRSFYLAASI